MPQVPDTLSSRLIALIAETQEIEAEKISLDADFEEIGLTSLNALSIAFEIEHEFGVTIREEEAFGLRNVRQAVAMVAGLLAETTGARAAAAEALASLHADQPSRGTGGPGRDRTVVGRDGLGPAHHGDVGPLVS